MTRGLCIREHVRVWECHCGSPTKEACGRSAVHAMADVMGGPRRLPVRMVKQLIGPSADQRRWQHWWVVSGI